MKRIRPPYENDQIRARINQRIHSARDREIMVMTLCDDISYEAIAEAFGMSRSQIARIVPRCEEVLFLESK